ncbi:MAG: patatin-like phospholipase family protein [Pseudomonadota bacterium]
MQAGPQAHTFDLGLVMAGAISAGAYTAGVMDFLIQALDSWQEQKSQPNAGGLRHEVTIRVISGASAGAMTSALSAVSFNSRIEPVAEPDHPPAPEANRLYDAWVRQIDIARLLTTSDIEERGKVRSLLNADPLQAIATEALTTPQRESKRQYVSDPLALVLSIANLRGVPYGFDVHGDPARGTYGMYEHMDHLWFASTWTGQALAGARTLLQAEAPGGEWPALLSAALASGAFPIGLAPQRLFRPRQDYLQRHAHPPLFPTGDARYEFLCVDGGLMNNEPFELARRYLAGGLESRNPRAGDEATRAVILIDPFPNDAPLAEPYEPGETMTAVALGIFRALKNQARFKAEELDLALRPDVYSRFMISPSRHDGAGRQVEPAIASGLLNGFGGFLHESFRRHDFQLGRRNCQAFLKWHFCLPENNRLFAGTDEATRKQLHVRERDGTQATYENASGSTVNFLPIIPLVGSAAAEVPEPPVPSAAVVDFDALEDMIAKRLRLVGNTLIRSELKQVVGVVGAVALEKAWSWHYAGRMTAKMVAAIRDQVLHFK